jgi:hypothetical protein
MADEEKKKPAKPRKTTRKVTGQIHSGSVLIGLASGVLLVLAVEEYIRSAARARARTASASVYNRPAQGRIISASTAPLPIATSTCPWQKPLIIGA